MTEQDYYLTIDKPGFAEFKDRGSRFLAYAFPLLSTDDFKQQLQHLKKEHPKSSASLFCLSDWVRW